MPTPWPQPLPLTTSCVAADAGAAPTRAQQTAAMTHRLLTAKTRQGIASSGNLHRSPGVLRRAVERVDRARLADRVVAAEERRLEPADRAREIVDLEAVRVGSADVDELPLVAAADDDSRLADIPRPRDLEPSVRAHDLEPLPQR